MKKKVYKLIFLLFLISYLLIRPNIVKAQQTCDKVGDSCCTNPGNMQQYCNNSLVCQNSKCKNPAEVITCNNGTSISTAIGCIPFGNANDLIAFILKWVLGIAGGIAFLLILFAGFQIMTSRGDPNRLKAGQELLTSAIAGLVLLIFSIFILRVIGFNILNISVFKGP